jgi:hemerythrin
MSEFSVPEHHASQHRLAHATFVSTIDVAMARVLDEPDAVLEETHQYLRRWLLTHIMGMDRDLVHEINQARKQRADSPGVAD